jgi:hypothetical protein
MKKTSYNTPILLLLFLTLFLLYFSQQKQSSIKKESGISNNIKQEETKGTTKIVQLLQKQAQKATTQTYIIKNSITPEMLTYKHWSGSYKPSIFAISIQGAYVKLGETHAVSVNSEKSIKIRYDYSFMNGYKTGSREIEFIPLSEHNILELTFSWNEPTHIILQNARTVGQTVLPFNALLEKMDIHKYE